MMVWLLIIAKIADGWQIMDYVGFEILFLIDTIPCEIALVVA